VYTCVLAMAEAVADGDLGCHLQGQLSGRHDDSSEPDSDSDGESLPDGFVLDEDSDDERRRELMSGAAGISLVEAEAQTLKRARDEAGPALPPRELPYPLARHQARPPPACARCGKHCRQVSRLSSERLAAAADYGLDDELAAHFGMFRAAHQRLAFAGLLHDRLCPPAEQLELAFDVIVEIGLTLGCEHTQRVAQDGLERGSTLLAFAPTPDSIYDDCLLIALRSERYSTANLLIRQLPQLQPSAVCHPRTLRPTVPWPAGASTVVLDALVTAALSSGSPEHEECGAKLFIQLAHTAPIVDGWEAQLWLRNLYRWADRRATSAGTGAALQELYRAVVQRFGTGGFGADPPLVSESSGLTGPPEAPTAGTMRQLEPMVSGSAAEVAGFQSGAHHHTLAPEVIRAWMGHRMCKGKLCPYAQLLGRCPAVDAGGGHWSCFMCPTTTQDGHVRRWALSSNNCDRCSCCRALAQVQQRGHMDVRSRLHDFMQLPTPCRALSCDWWVDDEPAKKVDAVVAAFA
jgi:hypothetical protein